MSVIKPTSPVPGISLAAVDGLSREQLASRPVPGKLDILEVVCHLTNNPGPMIGALRYRASRCHRTVYRLANGMCML